MTKRKTFNLAGRVALCASALLCVFAVACTNPANPANPATPQHNDATLQKLEVSTGRLMQSFDPTTTEYNVLVADRPASITVKGTTTSDKATLSENNGKPQNISVSSSNIEIVVTAEDGTTKKTYTVNVLFLVDSKNFNEFTNDADGGWEMSMGTTTEKIFTVKGGRLTMENSTESYPAKYNSDGEVCLVTPMGSILTPYVWKNNDFYLLLSTGIPMKLTKI